MSEINTILALFVWAQYDFIGWYGIFKDNADYFNKSWPEYLYRTLKFILDYPISIFVMYYHYKISITDISLIYFLKQAGFADAIYILTWKIFNWDKEYTREGIYWLWWTPWGLIKTVYQSIKYGKIQKGTMSLREFQVQLVISLIIYIILKIYL